MVIRSVECDRSRSRFDERAIAAVVGDDSIERGCAVIDTDRDLAATRSEAGLDGARTGDGIHANAGFDPLEFSTRRNIQIRKIVRPNFVPEVAAGERARLDVDQRSRSQVESRYRGWPPRLTGSRLSQRSTPTEYRCRIIGRSTRDIQFQHRRRGDRERA